MVNTPHATRVIRVDISSTLGLLDLGVRLRTIAGGLA
jgi:hypothetical protein